MDDDRLAFLELLAPLDPRFGVEVHAYALMGTHFHLLVRSRRGGLAAAMRDLQHRWSLELTRRYGEVGPAFQSRYGSRLIEDETYLAVALAYVHLNPVAEGLAPSPDKATWTSHPAYLGLAPCPAWLRTDALLNLLGGQEAVHEAVLSRAALPPEVLEQALAPIHRTRGPLAPALEVSPERAMEEDIAELSASIEAVVGMPLSKLGAPQVGPGTNLRLHLAIYVLTRRSGLTQREIGELLGLHARQVAWIVQAQRREREPELTRWIEAWEAHSGERRGASSRA